MKPTLEPNSSVALRAASRFAPALGLGLVLVGLFGQAVFGSLVFYQRDIFAYWYPAITGFVRAIAEGARPFWNPYTAFGVPMAADPNNQILYPPTWLTLFLPPAAYFKLFVVGHSMLAGGGVYAFSRRRGLPAAASFLAAACWVASGPLLSTVSLYHHFASATWLPWVLVALDGALDRGSVGSVLALGTVAATQALAGSADLCFMTGLLAAAHACARVAFGSARPARVLRVVSISLPFALALSAVQWLPAFALLRGAARASLTPQTNLYWSVHPYSLFDLLVPRLVSAMPLNPPARAALFESREPLLASLYLGLPAAGLVAWAVIGSGRRRASLCAGVGFVFLLLAALGRHTPLMPLLLHLPAFSMFRYPPKYLVPASLLWALLVGLGMGAWLGELEEPARRRVRLLAYVLAVAALALLLSSHAGAVPSWLRSLSAGTETEAVALAEASMKIQQAGWLALLCALLLWARSRAARAAPWLSAALVLVTAGELTAAGRGVNPLAPAEILRYRPRLVDEVQRDEADPRVYVVPFDQQRRREEFVRVPEAWKPEWAWVVGFLDELWPPIAGRWGLRGSFDGDFNGLAFPVYFELCRTVREQRDTALGTRLLRLASVDYVVALEPVVFEGLPEVAQVKSVYASPIRLFHVPDTLPKAYAVGRTRIAPEPASYRLLSDPTFDIRREIILPAGAPSASSEDFQGAVTITRRRSDALTLETRLNAPGHLALTEAYDSGWEAQVDGAPVTVSRANLIFLAVPVPPGVHTVELRYRPRGWRVGSALSTVALVAGLAFWAVRWSRRSLPPLSGPT